MPDHLRDRINRKLDTLNEERLYQVLDYVEFLESKYAARQTPTPNAFQKFAEGIEDKMRAGKVSASTIAETMGLLNRAVGVLNGVAAAGKSVATDLANAAQRVGSAVADATTSTPPGATPPGTTPPGTTPPSSASPSSANPPASPPPSGPASGPASGEPRS